MIEPLHSAGDQLRAAWDNYFQAYSFIQSCQAPSTKTPHVSGFSAKFSHQLDTELAFISSYESKIQELKVAITRARNYLSGLATINSLPPEILTRVFQFVRAQHCDLHKLSSDKKHYPRYPDDLTHVCSLWRQIAISCCSLWSHIDLSPYDPCYGGLLARAETHVARAGQFSIELHVAEGRYGPSERTDLYNELYGFVWRISDRVETLNLFVHAHFRGFHRSVFKTLLLVQQPKLTKLIVGSELRSNTFIYAGDFDNSERDEELEDFELDLTNDQIENSLAPLITLELRGIFPLWSSTAYCGLVDLRLLSSTHFWSMIEEVKLIPILKSSPRLQILHFGLNIRGSTPDGDVTPIHFQDLQVVKIFPDREGSGACPSSILRLITLVQDLSVCPLVALTHRKTSPSWNGKNSLHVQG